MTFHLCRCESCGRLVNARVDARGKIEPYRHLPPSELGQKAAPDGGWFGHGRWCGGFAAEVLGVWRIDGGHLGSFEVVGFESEAETWRAALARSAPMEKTRITDAGLRYSKHYRKQGTFAVRDLEKA